MDNIKEGYYDGQIIAAEVIKCRFAKEGENRMEVELECGVFDDAHQPLAEHAKIYLELSGDYPKFGDTTRPFWQQSLARLHEIGFTGDDLTTLDAQLKQKPVRLNYRVNDKNGVPIKGGPVWYLSAARRIEKIAPADANAMLKQMMSGGFGAATSAPAANPFNIA